MPSRSLVNEPALITCLRWGNSSRPTGSFRYPIQCVNHTPQLKHKKCSVLTKGNIRKERIIPRRYGDLPTAFTEYKPILVAS